MRARLTSAVASTHAHLDGNQHLCDKHKGRNGRLLAKLDHVAGKGRSRAGGERYVVSSVSECNVPECKRPGSPFTPDTLFSLVLDVGVNLCNGDCASHGTQQQPQRVESGREGKHG